VMVIVGVWAMAEHGKTAALTATDKNTFHGLIMNTLCNRRLPPGPGPTL
jgi:hypothetical protein